MKWVTRHGVKFDRTACAWLIVRFIDPEATFAFLPADGLAAAVAAGARSFHDYAWTGSAATLPPDRVNFPRLLVDYGLDGDPALVLFGEAVRQAEQVGWAKDGTEHYSLWAITNGIAALSQGDDAAIVRRMLPVYDALYAYCGLRAAGQTGWTSDR